MPVQGKSILVSLPSFLSLSYFAMVASLQHPALPLTSRFHTFRNYLWKEESALFSRVHRHAPSIRSRKRHFQPMRFPENRFAVISFRKIQFLPPCIWNLLGPNSWKHWSLNTVVFSSCFWKEINRVIDWFREIKNAHVYKQTNIWKFNLASIS